MRSLLAAAIMLSACAAVPAPSSCPVEDIRAAIDAEIQKGAEATRNEDIDAYMDGIPDDYRIVEDDGSITDKAKLREFALRSWAIIDETIDLKISIDEIDVHAPCNEAVVRTSQRWERMMRRRDDSGSDNVVTTQKHIEKWRLRDSRWYNYEITELGGEIFINGAPYLP